MRVPRLAGIVVAGALSCHPASRPAIMTVPDTLPADEAAQGFRPLFDGATTAGWRGYRLPDMPAGWQVVDGALTRVAAGGDIVSVDEFANFDLRLQWKVAPGGNSGIMYRGVEDYPESYTSAPEYQVLDDERHADGRSRLTSAASCYALYPSPPGIVHPADQWNDARIVVRGAHVEHWLNGVKVVEYDLWSDDWRSHVQHSKFAAWPWFGMAHRGHLVLQDHGDRVAYRMIRIKELP